MFNKKSGILLVSGALALLPLTANAQSPEFTKEMDAFLGSDAGIEKMMKAFERYSQKKQAQQQKEEGASASENYKKFFSIGNSPVKGNKNAKVTIVEIADFRCGYCSRGNDTIKEVLKAYPKDVKVVFKNQPIMAKPAAIAGIAAHQQGKFWEMADLMFQNQRELSDEKILELAESLKLNMKKFKADLENPKIIKQVEDDSEMATKLGVTGTPGFFINGIPVRGAQPLEVFKSIIDDELAKGKKK